MQTWKEMKNGPFGSTYETTAARGWYAVCPDGEGQYITQYEPSDEAEGDMVILAVSADLAAAQAVAETHAHDAH